MKGLVSTIDIRPHCWVGEGGGCLIGIVVVSSASGDLYSILKRPDEKYITENIFDHPMFVEDVVREVARKLDSMDRITWYTVEAESQESIHNHNAYARVEKKK